MEFQVGDKVRWQSNSARQNFYGPRTGTVVSVLPPFKELRDARVTEAGRTQSIRSEQFPNGHISGGSSRTQTSYLVQSGNLTRLFWPVVSQLQLVSRATSPETANKDADNVLVKVSGFADPAPLPPHLADPWNVSPPQPQTLEQVKDHIKAILPEAEAVMLVAVKDDVMLTSMHMSLNLHAQVAMRMFTQLQQRSA